MKRWKKALSGLLMAALMVTGISFPENVFAVSAGMDGLPSVVNSGIGKMVDKSSTIDGTYNFTPVIGANTKIRFGCSDGSGSWDNKFCLNAEQHAHACSQWWPLSNINDGGNTRSFIPYERLKGKMYAEYTNVGNANGLPVTMRIWFLDWQNTDISGYPGYEDVDNVVVSVDNTKGGATPVIDIKGLKWIKVRFSYYDENGNPLKVKGHFTLSDLDYSQGFYIDGIKLPLATMQQRRETWGSQSKLDVQEPMIFILQSTVEKLSVGDKIPLSDADSFLIHQESGVLNYELHYLMNGTPQEYNAFLDLSKVKVADTLMDGVTHSTPPALSDYLERHQQLNDTELGAKRLQKLNCDSKNVSYANALLSYVREARECLNSGKQLPQRPTRSSITLEKPNEEVAVPLSEQTPEETAVPDLNSAPEISIPSSNNEEVMQHQNTTPESPEAEHQQAKMENLMDISLPLVDQEPFQEILQALLKNDMSQAANLLQYLGSHLDKLQEEHQKMQVEFRELKEQVNSIDERFFNDSDSVDTVQNNLDQSEKLITLNKSRLANVVLQTKSKLKTAGKNALLSFAEKIHVPKALASLQKGMQHTQDSLDVLFQRLNDAKQAVQDVSNSVKNVGRALTGKELLEYVPWDPEKGKIASVQRKIYAMERTLGNLQERTNTLLSKMQRPEQKPEKQVKKTTKKVI